MTVPIYNLYVMTVPIYNLYVTTVPIYNQYVTTVPIYNLYVTTVPIYNLYVISDVRSNFSMGGSKKIRHSIDKLSLLTCLERVQPWSPSPFLLHWS